MVGIGAPRISIPWGGVCMQAAGFHGWGCGGCQGPHVAENFMAGIFRDAGTALDFMTGVVGDAGMLMQLRI